jgi:hypothetical protein
MDLLERRGIVSAPLPAARSAKSRRRPSGDERRLNLAPSGCIFQRVFKSGK